MIPGPILRSALDEKKYQLPPRNGSKCIEKVSSVNFSVGLVPLMQSEFFISNYRVFRPQVSPVGVW